MEGGTGELVCSVLLHIMLCSQSFTGPARCFMILSGYAGARVTDLTQVRVNVKIAY